MITNVNWRRLCESSDRMNMVIKNDNADHHSQTKHHRLLGRELTTVLPVIIRTKTKINKRISNNYLLQTYTHISCSH